MITRSQITVDDRQQTPPSDIRADELNTLGVPAQVMRLDLGDYQWTATNSSGETTGYLIEEKLLPDFLASANDGRLGRFVQGEVGESTVKALLLIGTYEYGADQHHIHWDMSQIDNLLASIQLAGVLVMRAATPAQAAHRIAAFWKYTGNEEHRTLDRPIRPSTSKYYVNAYKRDAVRFLMCLPSVGEGKARALLDEHGSVDSVLACLSTNKSCDADGIGPTIVAKAKEFLARGF